MKIRLSYLFITCIVFAVTVRNLSADIFTPDNLSAPFGVQPFVGSLVNMGVTDSFFSDLSGLPFPGPGILNVLGNLQAFDSVGDSISMFSVTGVTVTQGSSFSPMLGMFSLSTPMTYASTLNPLNEATVDPANLNLAFAFDSDPSFQYFFTLSVSGVPDGGFVLFDDVEGSFAVPEPVLTLPIALAVLTAFGVSYWRRKLRFRMKTQAHENL